MKKYLVMIIVLVMLVSIVAGCSNNVEEQSTASDTSETGTEANGEDAAESSQDASEEQTIDFNETSTLNLDWFATEGTDSSFEFPWRNLNSEYADMVFDTLVKLDSDGVTYLPRLAEAWDISVDGKSYTFTIVENAKWHDGTPVTAEDVEFSLNTSVACPDAGLVSAFVTNFAGAQEIREGNADALEGLTVDGNKITVTLNTPDSGIMKSVFSRLYILPKHLLKDVDPTLLSTFVEYWAKPVGSGPYVIEEVSYPDSCKLVSNEEYFGDKPKIKNVKFISHTTGGIESVAADMIAGNIDFVTGQRMSDINIAKNIVAQNPDVKMIIVPATYFRLMYFNNVGSSDDKYNDDMQKKEVRQALNLMMDKAAIASFYQGLAVPLSTNVNPDLPAYNTDIPLFQRDVETAKQMLISAGFNFDRPVRLLYYYDDQTTKDIMELLKQNFAEAGVKLEPFLATGDLGSIIYEVKNWDMMYAGNTNLDAMWTYRLVVPDEGMVDGIFGDVEYREEVFGTLFTDYKATSDPTEMKEIGDRLQAESYTYCMIAPVYGLNKIVLYNTSKLSIPEEIFDIDLHGVRDNKYDEWELLK